MSLIETSRSPLKTDLTDLSSSAMNEWKVRWPLSPFINADAQLTVVTHRKLRLLMSARYHDNVRNSQMFAACYTQKLFKAVLLILVANRAVFFKLLVLI